MQTLTLETLERWLWDSADYIKVKKEKLVILLDISSLLHWMKLFI